MRQFARGLGWVVSFGWLGASLLLGSSAQELALSLPDPGARSFGSIGAPDGLRARPEPHQDERRPRRRGDAGADGSLNSLLEQHEGNVAEVRPEGDARFDDLVRWLNEPLRFTAPEPDLAQHVALPNRRYAPVTFMGVDRVVAAEVGRFYQRALRNTLQEVYGRSGPDRRWEDEADEARRIYRARRDDEVEARFARRFHDYWLGSARPRPVREATVEVGETMPVLRLFGYTVQNDLRVRRSAEARLPLHLRSIGAGAPTAERHPPGVHLRTVRPRGDVWESDRASLDAMARVSVRGIRSMLMGQVELKIYDDRFDEEVVSIQLRAEVAPITQDAEVALLLELRMP